MKKIFLFSITIFFIVLSNESFSQGFRGDTDTNATVYYTPTESFTQFEDTVTYTNRYNNSIGLRFSTFSGYGISASRKIVGPLTIAISGFFKFSEHTEWNDMSKSLIVDQTKNNLYSFGAELRGDIITTKTVNIYVVVGGSISEDSNVKTVGFGNEISQQNLGLGFGFQWFRGKRIAFDLNSAYIYQITDEVVDKKPTQDKGTLLGFSIGFQYFF